MPDEDQLSLRQADQIRGDLYGIQDDIDFIKVQLAHLPTRNEVWRAAMLGMIGGALAAVTLIEGVRRSVALGHADVLEPHRDRLALRDCLHSHTRVIMSEETRNPDANVFLLAECIAAIKAAVAEERARCAAIVRSRAGDLVEIIAQAIERDEPPQSEKPPTRETIDPEFSKDWRDAVF